ncbi:MAG TPA: hypothetical protein VMZ71_16795 [Gemmataceae bacterium]|nr:hypothetical protein [Gemmataceae bacterium]
MIYVVSGFPRSGTSMMMRAAEAGGIACVYAPHGDANRNRNTLIPGYVPNPHGFYEDAPLDGDWYGFEGKCVKVLSPNFHTIPTPPPELRVVYMVRDPAEIRRSYYGILSGPHPESVYDFLDGYKQIVRADIELLDSVGADTIMLHYSDVVADPRREFAKLAAAGWPIDVDAAAAIVDPALYRHRGAA